MNDALGQLAIPLDGESGAPATFTNEEIYRLLEELVRRLGSRAVAEFDTSEIIEACVTARAFVCLLEPKGSHSAQKRMAIALGWKIRDYAHQPIQLPSGITARISKTPNTAPARYLVEIGEKIDRDDGAQVKRLVEVLTLHALDAARKQGADPRGLERFEFSKKSVRSLCDANALFRWLAPLNTPANHSKIGKLLPRFAFHVYQLGDGTLVHFLRKGDGRDRRYVIEFLAIPITGYARA